MKRGSNTCHICGWNPCKCGKQVYTTQDIIEYEEEEKIKDNSIPDAPGMPTDKDMWD